MKKFILTLVCIHLFVVSFAQVTHFGPYYELKGDREFTGQMLVKPLEVTTLLQKHGNYSFALAQNTMARIRIAPYVIEHETDIDQYIINVPPGFTESSYAAYLQSTGTYKYAVPNYIVYPTLNPNDPMFNQQWHHQMIKTPQAWDIHTGSNTIICAFTDTGIDKNHEDLKDSLVMGYNSVDKKTEAEGGNINDVHGHGTHVAGCGAAITNNAKGVAGVGWNFKIMMVKVSNSSSGGSSYDALLGGARWAVDNGAKVISTSYSGVESAAVQETGAYIRSKDALYLWAAGNSGSNLSWFDWADVIIVGASNQSDNRASWSSYGKAVDFFAPGVDILSTTKGSTYGTMSGTSMATPIANGLCALVWTKNPRLTSYQVEMLIKRTCDDKGAPGKDDVWGWGRINAFNAIKAAQVSSLPKSR